MEREAPAWRDAVFTGWRPYAFLAAIVVVVYARCLTYGLILLDDNVFLGNRFSILSDWSKLPAVFGRGAFMIAGTGDLYYRPLMIVSFMLDAHLGGRNPDIFHFSNIVYHILSTALVFRVLRLIVGEQKALLSAALFAAHPALVNAVAWINGRTDSFLAIFVLASFHCYQLFLRDGRKRWMSGHLILWAAALLCKELAIVLPAACLAYAFLEGKSRPGLDDHGGLALGWAGGLAAWWLARRAILHPVPGQSYSLAGMLGSTLKNLPAALVYLGKFIAPVGLSPYPILRDSSLFLGTAAALAVGAACLWPRGADFRRILWGLCWFVLFLVPSFVYPDDGVTPVFFEYRLYLPALGLLVILSEAAPFRWFDLGLPTHALCAALLLLVFGSAAAADCGYYRDDSAAWSRAVEASPHSAFAHVQFGVSLLLHKDIKGAEVESLKALELEPQKTMAHNNLGVIYMNTGRVSQAEEQFRLELKANPDYDSALYNLGLACEAQGRHSEARELWRRALEVNPDYDDARAKLSEPASLSPR